MSHALAQACAGPKTGYEFFGELSVRNNTVALLISADFLARMWLHVHIPVGNERGFLLLATYAPPPSTSLAYTFCGFSCCFAWPVPVAPFACLFLQFFCSMTI